MLKYEYGLFVCVAKALRGNGDYDVLFLTSLGVSLWGVTYTTTLHYTTSVLDSLHIRPGPPPHVHSVHGHSTRSNFASGPAFMRSLRIDAGEILERRLPTRTPAWRMPPLKPQRAPISPKATTSWADMMEAASPLVLPLFKEFLEAQWPNQVPF